MPVADRCRNCGLRGHQTQNCPSWGPLFPGPGKTKADYAKLYETIQNKLAKDIVEEHQGHEVEEQPRTPRKRRVSTTDTPQGT
jgi:hypothetical protein